MSVATVFPAMVQFRDRIYVFDGIKEPEEYGSPLPPADRPDPNFTTVPTSTTVPVTVPATVPTAVPTTVPVSVPSATTSAP
jgi:hypothetical protein